MLRATNLDTDWFYRRLGRFISKVAYPAYSNADGQLRSMVVRRAQRLTTELYRHHGPHGVLARTWPTGSMVLWVAILLGAYLLLYFADIF